MSILHSFGLIPQSRIKNPDDIGYASRLINRIASEQFIDAEALLKGASDQARERLIYGFSISENAITNAAQWVKKSANSAFAHICLGASMIAKGWMIRGDSYADFVDATAWKPFFSQLNGAEEVLQRACQLDDSLSEPYAWLIHAGFGRGAEIKQLKNLYDESVKRNYLHYAVIFKYSNAITEKWGGSHKEMLNYTRQVCSELPKGHSLHYLVAYAYCELILSINQEKGQSAIEKTMRNHKCASEVENALFNYADAGATNLEERLERLHSPFTDRHINMFALALYQTGAIESAKILFKYLNNEIHALPWIWATQGIKQRFFPAFYFDKASRKLAIN